MAAPTILLLHAFPLDSRMWQAQRGPLAEAGYAVAGKTGTAQKIDPKTKTYSSTKYIGSFVGFAPAENPAVVIIVVIDEPAGAYHGGDVAAPVFREIAEQILPDLNVAPDTEIKTENPIASALRDAESAERVRAELERVGCLATWRAATLPQVAGTGAQGEGSDEVIYAPATSRGVLMPDLRGKSVRDAARICAQLGLEMEARGEGRALRQSPAAGAEVEAGRTVRIEFGRSD